MRDLVHIICWSFLFASVSAIAEFVAGKPGPFELNSFWKKTETLRIVRLIPLILLVLTVAILSWGFLNLRWYVVFLEALAGMVVSTFGLQHLNPIPRIYLGWLVVLANILWLFLKA